MAFRPRTRRFNAWLAILAFMLAALAPAVSQWLMASRHANVSWVEVCTSAGAKWVAIGNDAASIAQDAKAAPDDPSGQHAQAHCPFCLIQPHDLGLPPAPVALTLPPRDAAHLLPALFLQAPHTLFAWSPSLARAPPAHA